MMVPGMTDPADLGVAEASALLADGTLSASELVRACLARIRDRDGTHSHEGDPALDQRVGARLRGRRARRRRAGRRATQRRRGRPARRAAPPVRHPGRAEGSVRGGGEAPDRFEQPARRDARTGLRRLGPARSPGHGAPRTRPHSRVCGRRHDRPGRQPVGARPIRRRLERRLRSGARGADGARSHGHRHGRLAAHPVGDLRHVHDQAHARPRLDGRNRPARPEPRSRRPHGEIARRLRAPARRHGGPGPRPPGERSPAASCRAPSRALAARRCPPGRVAPGREGQARPRRRGRLRCGAGGAPTARSRRSSRCPRPRSH